MPGPRKPPLVLARWEIRPAGGSPTIRGELRAPRGPAPSTVVVLHTRAADTGGRELLRSLARAIAHHGHAALSVDEPHVADEIRSVLDAATGGRLFPHPPRRVALLGHAGGAPEAIDAAADPRVDALVTWPVAASGSQGGLVSAAARVTVPWLVVGEEDGAADAVLRWLDRQLAGAE
ncbi:MAG TPA: hypothetical protein VFL93_08570 [Longimicrobiaceae bacterium]|nr:hypothetical protein [Longimicrobiaceae bacterium]